MRYEDWDPIYREILSDFGYSRMQDETSSRLLRTLMLNADIITDDELADVLKEHVIIFGAADSLKDEIFGKEFDGTLISAGSATSVLMDNGIVPDIVVTDLDGNVDAQIEASKEGAVTLIHAHGDNADAIMKYAKSFTGKVVLTTQSKPDNLLRNYGGFTDGDRAYCMAKHFGVDDIELIGFDFQHPSYKDGSDLTVKAKKLKWAERIISSLR
ncbi:MAG: DUF115 domain-containing protein [Candidatus Methanomethylophilaceae archaeon]|nr:DUF115 domain-containing protein [Candidatus Methanomethylophilaceae archaeon]